MQRIGILGSTGSIGTAALDVIRALEGRFIVSALSAHENVDLLLEQVRRFRPQAACVVDLKKAKEFRKKSKKRPGLKFYEGGEGLCKMISDIKIDTLIMGIVGSSALLPVLASLGSVKRLALANKEALVMAGDIIIKKARENSVKILPIDSEHSAIFQCIDSRDRREIKKIYLTGSGGPLLHTPVRNFKNVTPKKAINHPKWRMGKKISVDSATLMNKGLEVIEAHHLFGTSFDKIKVLIHPEAVVHSMVEFVDGSILAHMGACDMKIPIQYALTYPSRVISSVKPLDFSKSKKLSFYPPDLKKFPCLRLAYEAASGGGTYPCVLNASNEVAVEQFLKRIIGFTDIPRIIEKVLSLHRNIDRPKLEHIFEADAWARSKAKELSTMGAGLP